MIIILTTVIFSLYANASRLDAGEPFPLRRACDMGAVNTCIAHETTAEQECSFRASGYKSQENIVIHDLELRQADLADVLTASANISAQIQTARAELEFLDDLEKKSSSKNEIIRNFLTVENYFSLDHLSTAWQEQYPQQYRKKLIDQDSELTNSSQKFAHQQSEIESEINSLLNTRAFYSGEKNRWENDRIIHARMLQNGCREQVCPPNS